MLTFSRAHLLARARTQATPSTSRKQKAAGAEKVRAQETALCAFFRTCANMRALTQAISEMVESPRKAIQEKKKRNEEKRALREAENKVRRQEAGVHSDNAAEAARRGLWKPVETDFEFRGVVFIISTDIFPLLCTHLFMSMQGCLYETEWSLQ